MYLGCENILLISSSSSFNDVDDIVLAGEVERSGTSKLLGTSWKETNWGKGECISLGLNEGDGVGIAGPVLKALGSI